ncbi:hypothetical protein CKF54_04660 [Psittacicella hinzii]|uniref:Type I restriction modification DNA specificity domain-containing protein n=1 Tax=Psittacicella hinzii TaxID=2028575 RepID=A0A3A1Y561_9GAMM|nr:restriction endonuclease subunit S [Psittacicella hinzii]RIY32510.1 hypothetical protein CKF54_04660 [Psittacicella hinzii]
MQESPLLSFTKSNNFITTSLEDIVDFINYRKNLTLERTGKYQAVSIAAIGNGSRVIEFNGFTDQEEILLKEGDIVMAFYGYCGRSAIVTENDKYVLNPRVCLIRVKDKNQVDPYYLQAYFLLHKSRKFIHVISQGTAQQFITVTNLKALPVTMPSIEEQRKIGKIFKDVDDQVVILEQKLNNLLTLKQRLVKDLIPNYVYKGTHKTYPTRRFAGFTDPWKWYKIHECAEVISGGTPSTKVEKYWGGDINWLTPTEVGKRLYAGDSQRKITPEGYKACTAKMLPVGAILFSSRATIGNTAILEKEACTNQGFQSFVVNEDKLTNIFMYTLIPIVKYQADRYKHGTTFEEISKSEVKEFVIPLTSFEEQNKITKLTFEVDKLIDLHRVRLELMKKFKTGLLQHLFI